MSNLEFPTSLGISTVETITLMGHDLAADPIANSIFAAVESHARYVDPSD
jgi:hypothetical protein